VAAGGNRPRQGLAQRQQRGRRKAPPAGWRRDPNALAAPAAAGVPRMDPGAAAVGRAHA